MKELDKYFNLMIRTDDLEYKETIELSFIEG
jgi:hypothetical protein